MAKRKTSVGKNRKSRSHKTAKRLAIKREMLASRRSRPTKRASKKHR